MVTTSSGVMGGVSVIVSCAQTTTTAVSTTAAVYNEVTQRRNLFVDGSTSHKHLPPPRRAATRSLGQEYWAKKHFTATLLGGAPQTYHLQKKNTFVPPFRRAARRAAHTRIFSLRVFTRKLAKQLHFNSTLEPDGYQCTQDAVLLGRNAAGTRGEIRITRPVKSFSWRHSPPRSSRHVSSSHRNTRQV